MGRRRFDRRHSANTRAAIANKKRGKYNNYINEQTTKNLQKALVMIQRGKSCREAAEKCGIPKSTLSEAWNKFMNSSTENATDFEPGKQKRLTVLTEEEEEAVVKYVLWECDRGMPLVVKQIKAIIREINQKALVKGEKRKKIDPLSGPSNKYMAAFMKRYPKLSHRNSESVDRGRINMANKDTITDYFELLKETIVRLNIASVDNNGDILQDKMKKERIYLADETGWGVEKQSRRVVGRKGASHIYHRKANDESHKTLMLTVCGNGEVLKPLIILENSFPLVGEGESEHLPNNILLSKTENGSMEKDVFVQWLKEAVIPHKQEHNPDEYSLLLVDNHGSRFSAEAIDLCISNKTEMLCYPGHLTHILQGPDVVLNKPINTEIQNILQNNHLLSGNTDLTRIAFIATVDHAVKKVCTPEMVQKAFSATGVIPFNPAKVDLSKFPSSSQSGIESGSPVQATCSECRVNNVALHPLVKQKLIPKKLADVFVYTPPPNKSKTKCKVVKRARIVTSEEVKAEILEVEARKKKIKTTENPKDVPKKSAIQNKMPETSTKKQVSKTKITEHQPKSSTHASPDSDENADFVVNTYDVGNYCIVHYKVGKKALYYAAVISETIKDNDGILYNVDFFKKCGMKDLFTFDDGDSDTIGEECIYSSLPEPELVEKQEYIYYKFDYDHSIYLQ